VKVAETVTALFGIVNVHGLLETPPEQEAPDTAHLENDEPEEGVAVIEIDEATSSEHPFGSVQDGLTVPEPELILVNSV
jgi:hypothetical protein